MKSDSPYLSVIVPVYNEIKRLRNLERINAYLQKKKYTVELIIVDDGSNKKTRDLLYRSRKRLRFKLIHYKKNQGKGFAIREGMLEASGKYRIFTDIDLSTPIESLERFLSALKKYDVVIATRKGKTSEVLVHQSFLRESMGKFFTFLSRQTTGVDVSDFTCGFKGFSRNAAIRIFSQLRTKRWSFDTESLFLANKYGYSIHEIPVLWTNNSETKVTFPRDIVTSLKDIVLIKIYSFSGKYQSDHEKNNCLY